jgi:hypothetical protein
VLLVARRQGFAPLFDDDVEIKGPHAVLELRFIDGAHGDAHAEPFQYRLVEQRDLALQLPFCFEVRALSNRLVSSTPERPPTDQ